MFSKKITIYGFIFLSLTGLIVYSQIMQNEKTVYQENFENGNLEGDFLRCEGDELSLDLQNSAQTGEGVWSKDVNLPPGRIS
jgi:hypothetical protein